jgi:hypothetical protein
MALPDYITSAEPISVSTGIANFGLVPGNRVLSSIINNDTLRYDFLDLEVVYYHSATPATTNTVHMIWLLYSYDGTNWEFGDASNDPDVTARVIAAWTPPGTTVTRRFVVGDIPLLHRKFRFLVKCHASTGVNLFVTLNASLRYGAKVID